MIVFDHVWKEFSDGNWAIRDLSLEVNKGETLVLLGKSGSGKTSIIKLVNRLIDPTKGRVLVDGQDVLLQNPIELRRKIGYAVQEVGLLPHLTVEENIGIVPKLLRWPKEKIDERINALLEMMGMDPDEFRKSFPLKLSGGQRQRIGVARALAADPPIVLMDEPFGALDPITREQTQKEFVELESRIKKTVIFVTHDLFEAVMLGDRIALIDQGRLIQVATPTEFVANPPSDFADQFLGRHRFQLGLMTKTISECMTPGSAPKSGVTPENLEPRSSLLEALESFKSSRLDSLPIIENGNYKGELQKTKLLKEISALLVDQTTAGASQ